MKALARLHSRYSEEHGRIYPMYDDDDGAGAATSVGFDDAVEDVFYQWVYLEGATDLLAFSGRYEGLLNAVASLASWHPAYNDRNGLID